MQIIDLTQGTNSQAIMHSCRNHLTRHSYFEPQRIEFEIYEKFMGVDMKLGSDFHIGDQIDWINYVLSYIPVYIVDSSQAGQRITVSNLGHPDYDVIVPDSLIKRPRLFYEDFRGMFPEITPNNDSERIKELLDMLINDIRGCVKHVSDIEMSPRVEDILRQVFLDTITRSPELLHINMLRRRELTDLYEPYREEIIAFPRWTDPIESTERELRQYAHRMIGILVNAIPEFAEYVNGVEGRSYDMHADSRMANIFYDCLIMLLRVAFNEQIYMPDEPMPTDDNKIGGTSVFHADALYIGYGPCIDKSADPKLQQGPQIFLFADHIFDTIEEYKCRHYIGYVLAHEFTHALMDTDLWVEYLQNVPELSSALQALPPAQQYKCKEYVIWEEALATAMGWHIVGCDPRVAQIIDKCGLEYRFGLTPLFRSRLRLCRELIPRWISRKLCKSNVY